MQSWSRSCLKGITRPPRDCRKHVRPLISDYNELLREVVTWMIYDGPNVLRSCIFLMIRSVLVSIPSSEGETGHIAGTSTSQNKTGYKICNLLIKNKIATPSCAKKRHGDDSKLNKLGIKGPLYRNECVEVSRKWTFKHQSHGTTRLDDSHSKSNVVTDLSTLSDGQSAPFSAKPSIKFQIEIGVRADVDNIFYSKLRHVLRHANAYYCT